MKPTWKRIISFSLVLMLLLCISSFASAQEPTEDESVVEDTTEDVTEPIDDTVSEDTQYEEAEETTPIEFSLSARANSDGHVYKNGQVWASNPNKVFEITYDGVTRDVDNVSTYAVMWNGIYHPCYCIDPILPYAEYGGYTANEWTVAEQWNSLSIAQRRALGLLFIYGYPNGVTASTTLTKRGAHAATQMIVREICYGMRSSTAPFTCTDTRFIDLFESDDYGNLFTDGISSANNARVYNLKSSYYTIAENMANHFVVPSFAATDKAFAQTYEMKANSDGTYSVTLTDTNNILSKCKFTNTSDLTFSVSGNKLTITSKKAVSDITVTASKNVPNLDTQTYIVWTYEGKQTLVQPLAPTNDPMPIYFKLKASSGNVTIKKTTEDGKNLPNWQFNIYSDKACTTLISGPHTTNSNGTVTVTGLNTGTVWIKEIGNTNASINSLYKCSSTNPQSVTITSGATSTVTFNNTLIRGSLTVKKATTSGSGADLGWTFKLYKVESDNSLTYITSGTTKKSASDPTYTFTNLLPGKYAVQEDQNSSHEGFKIDTSFHYATVSANSSTTVTVTNTHLGIGKIVKTMPDGGSAAGWKFDIYKADNNTHIGTFTTDSDGTFTTDYLLPGNYLVYELIDDDSVYECSGTNPKTLTVTAGKTATVTFENRLKSGQISIMKIDTRGNPLAGAEFLLEWSEDGVNWNAVTYIEDPGISNGTCNSVGLTYGRLISGADGKVSFTGLHPTLQYRITETKAPDGYQLLSDYAYTGGLSIDNDLTVTLTVVNAPIYMLPMTGSYSLILAPFAVSLSAALGALIVFKTGRGKRK